MIWFCLPCLALLLYFLILGIFIPKYKIYVKEAWKCFLDKLRGRKCPVYFDVKMRKTFVLWLARHNLVGAARFFDKKRNFELVLITFLIIFSIFSTYLFWLFIKFFFIKHPCPSGKGICPG